MLTDPSKPASRGRAAPRTISRRRPLPARRGMTSPAAERRGTDEAPLRLVGRDAADGARAGGPDPIQGVHDPRWVLAVRVGEKLEGAILRPEHRSQLLRIGRMLGLSIFDCNLVIAIVQDQARRGHESGYCATAGEDQLRMIPLPKQTTFLQMLRQRPAVLIAGILGTLILIELALLQWLF